MGAGDAGPAAILDAASGDYPAGLRDLPDPPARLYVHGRLVAGERCVAIVGSRAATPYGVGLARRLAADLASLGITVVSGLARGVDAAAHLGAVQAGGRTIAVLPGGAAMVTPAEHAALAAKIAAQGAVVSEWPDSYPVLRGMFLRRNRLIAALASVAVVVEAAARSGALSTAAVARRLGRPCLAVPGDVDRVTSRGCHALIRAGAGVCEGAADVLDALARGGATREAAGRCGKGASVATRPMATMVPARGRGSVPVAAVVAAPSREGGETGHAAALLAVLGAEPRSLECLAGGSGLTVAEALAALLRLEWSGLAVALPGQRWARRAGERV